MDDQQQRRLRLGLLTELVCRAPVKLGRTAVMKLAYFLQTTRAVPLGYRFRLYIYGPFDADVLSDLDQACAIGALSSQMVTSSSGYGYEFTPGPKHAVLQRLANKDLAPYQSAIRWVIEKYSAKSAGELELLSTIVSADKEVNEGGRRMSFVELGRMVKQIKPRFSDAVILQNIRELAHDGLLVAPSEGE